MTDKTFKALLPRLGEFKSIEQDKQQVKVYFKNGTVLYSYNKPCSISFGGRERYVVKGVWNYSATTIRAVVSFFGFDNKEELFAEVKEINSIKEISISGD